MISIINKDNCCGCNACQLACPVGCIRMVSDNEGFLYPQVELDLCLDCGICEKVCPMLPDIPAGEVPLAFAAWNTNDAIRLASSSGGVFHALMSRTLLSGGVVFGAAFDDQMQLRHQYAETMEDASKFCKSKYVQSVIGDSYKVAKKFLDKNRKVLFSGTPCQIAGLNSFINNENANLLTCDVVCHGVPSPKVLSFYRSHLESKQKAIIKKIEFRDKYRGWKEYSISFLFDTKKELKRPYWEDAFMIGFLKNIFLRPSCHSCRFSRFPRVADISLADFWGVNGHHPEWDDDRGTSLVLVQTEKGKTSFEACKSDLITHDADLNIAIGSNRCICCSVPPDENRESFFYDLDRLPFEKVLHKYIKTPSLWAKASSISKRMLKFCFKFIFCSKLNK